jgi:hypothetical protein
VVADAGIAPLIVSLRGTDPANRSLAAAELFDRGVQSIRTVLDAWLAFPALSHLLERDAAAQKLKITVGIAVAPEAFERIHAANGSPPLANVPPDQDAREFELEFTGGVKLDILTTRDSAGQGAIARYLRKFGPGIQQVEIGVRSVDRAQVVLREQFKIEPIYPQTRAGADGTRVNFFLVPAGAKKVLIELVESLANSQSLCERTDPD